jgi:predicted secreted Zn-dependent protease
MGLIKTLAAVLLFLMYATQASAVVYQYFDEEGTLIVTNNPHRTGRSRGPSRSSASVRSEARDGITYEYYQVAGRTFHELAAAAADRGPFDSAEGKTYPAQTRWSAGWTYRFTSSHRVEGYNLRASVRIYDIAFTSNISVVLPALADGIMLQGEERRQWDDYLRVLREHEGDHVAIIRDSAFRDEAVRRMEGVTEVVVANDPSRDPMELVQHAVEEETARIGHEVIRKIKARNDDYDSVTQHGQRHDLRAGFFKG